MWCALDGLCGGKMAKKTKNSVKRSLYYYDFVWNIYDETKNSYISVKRKEERFTNFLEKFHFANNQTVDKEYILSTEKGDNLFIITDKIRASAVCRRSF